MRSLVCLVFLFYVRELDSFLLSIRVWLYFINRFISYQDITCYTISVSSNADKKSLSVSTICDIALTKSTNCLLFTFNLFYDVVGLWTQLRPKT